MEKETQKSQPNTSIISVADVHTFLEWLNNQKKDYMCGEFLYNVKGHGYPRLKQGEMFDYWLEHIHLR